MKELIIILGLFLLMTLVLSIFFMQQVNEFQKSISNRVNVYCSYDWGCSCDFNSEDKEVYNFCMDIVNLSVKKGEMNGK